MSNSITICGKTLTQDRVVTGISYSWNKTDENELEYIKEIVVFEHKRDVFLNPENKKYIVEYTFETFEPQCNFTGTIKICGETIEECELAIIIQLNDPISVCRSLQGDIATKSLRK